MKKLSILFAILMISAVSLFAQAPQKFSYQAVLRDAGNSLVTNHAVGVRISILQGDVNGTVVYMETQATTTNSNGLMTLQIGEGSVVSGDMSAIDWANGPFFLKTETDPTGGANYTIEGTQQLLSVPYALYAQEAYNGFSGNIADYLTPTTTAQVVNALQTAGVAMQSDIPANQVLSISHDTLFLTNGGFVKLPEGFDGDYNSLINTPILFSGAYNDLTGKPDLAPVATSGDYDDLINKPIIPTVPSGVSAFANDAGYITMDSVPAIPTEVSAFINDAGYLTMDSLAAESDPTVPAWAKENTKPVYDYSEIQNTPELPTVPTNVSAFTNDAGYITMDSILAIPTEVSAFINDAGYLTMDSLAAESDPTVPAWAKENTKPVYDYSEIQNTPELPTVPTNVSAFTNDAGYITMDSILAIPTEVSAFINDAGYITMDSLAAESDPTVPAWAKESTKPVYDYSEIQNTPELPTVPTNVSAFTNDAGYITMDSLAAESDPTVPAWAKESTKPVYDYSEIQNTPELPTVPTNVSAFTNDAGYITVDSIPAIPTEVSAFTNDAGYLTTDSLAAESDPTVPAWAKESTKPVYDYSEIQNTPELPTVPTNVSAFTNDAGYLTVDSIAAESDPTVPAWAKESTKPVYDYSEIQNTPEIPTVPTNVSAFTNDAGYITMDSVPAIPTEVSVFTNDAGYLTRDSIAAESDPTVPAWAKESTKPAYDYSEIQNTPEIPTVPTNVSAFTNDAGFITNADIPEIPAIPENVSAFNNDVPYLIVEQQILSISNDTIFLTGGSFVKLPAGFDGSYNSLTDKPEIPTIPDNVSTFSNDAGYITMADIQVLLNQLNNRIDSLEALLNNQTATPQLSTVTTDTVYDITENTATCSGNITSDGGATVTACGVCWSTSANPTVEDNHVDAGTGTGSFTVNITGLAPNTTYHVRTYATNSEGTAYGEEVTFTTLCKAMNLTISGNSNFCETEPVTLMANVDMDGLIPANLHFVWYENDQVRDNMSYGLGDNNMYSEYLYARTDPYRFTVEIIYDGGCVAQSGEHLVYVYSMPENPIVMVDNPMLSEGGAVTLTVTNPVAGAVYTWYRNGVLIEGATQAVLIDVPTTVGGEATSYTYNVMAALDVNGCISGISEPTTVTVSIPVTLPTVTTGTIGDITGTTAICSGEVTNNGGAEVTAWGVCWSTSQNPTIADSYTSNGAGVGSITGLLPNTTYYVRAYATNSAGTAYGEEVSFTTLCDVPTITISGDTEITVGATATLTASGVDSYQWSTGETTASITVTPEATTTYSVTGTNQYGCTATASVTVTVTATTIDTTATPVDGQPCPGTPTVTDHEGNVYNTVQIGNQCWTRENLRTTTSPSTGTYLIPPAGTGDTYTGKQALWPGNDSATYAPMNYGLLYNWNAAMDVFNTEYGETSVETRSAVVSVVFTGYHRGICPEGWHVPSDAEWTTLTDYVGSQSEYTCGGNSSNIAKALASTTGWGYDDRSGTCSIYTDQATSNNATNFSAVPASSVSMGFAFWSSTQKNSSTEDAYFAYERYAITFQSAVERSDSYKFVKRSVRCIRDEAGGGPSAMLFPATVTTSAVIDITETTATFSGEVTDDGGSEVTERGVCWAKYSSPSIYSNHIVLGTGTGTFTVNVSDLTPNTTYYVRAYAINGVGISYAEAFSFTTLCTVPTVAISGVTEITDGVSTTLTASGADSYQWSTSETTASIIGSPGTYTVTGTNQYGCTATASVTVTIAGYSDGIPCPAATTVTDIDGNTYNTVQIGDQCWMRENLRTTHFPDGSAIPLVTSTSETNPYYIERYVPVNISADRSAYLYNWPAVMNGASSSNSNPSGVQGICPDGWHVPSNAEWIQLTNYVKSRSLYCCSNNTGYIAKALAATTGWDNHATATCAVGNILSNNNATGFSALPVGEYVGDYSSINDFSESAFSCHFWTATSYNSSDAYSRSFGYENAQVFTTSYGKGAGCSVRCLRDNENSHSALPTVTTSAVSDISFTTATCSGEVTNDGGADVTDRGVCWNTSQVPTVADRHTTDGTGTGSFTSSLTGLTPNTTYYVRAYATNSEGTAYGEELSFTTITIPTGDAQPCPGAATVTDVDGNTYNTVQIGNQCWMNENLRTTRYANGTTILLGTSTSTTTSYRYCPNNDANNVPIYGYLYNWPAVMNGASSSNSNPSNVQGICPDGWHVPSDAEWAQLTNYVSSQSQYWCSNSSENIAKALASTSGWNSSSTACTVGNTQSNNNATGFSALPAGDYYGSGYDYSGYSAYFWSATEASGTRAYYRYLSYHRATVDRLSNPKSCGYSVRCVRD